MLSDLALARCQLALQQTAGVHHTPVNPLPIIASEMNALTAKFGNHAICSITDRCGNIVYANPCFCKVLGFSERQLIGKNHRIINSRYHQPAHFVGLWKNLLAGKDWRSNIKNRSKYGSELWWDTLITPMGSRPGVHDYFFSVRGDVTEAVERTKNQISVAVDGKAVILEPENIRMIAALGNYSQVHTVDGNKILVKKTMKEWQEKLDPIWFFRIHRAYLVNFAHVHTVRNQSSRSSWVDLRGIAAPITCSRRNAGALKKAIAFKQQQQLQLGVFCISPEKVHSMI